MSICNTACACHSLQRSLQLHQLTCSFLTYPFFLVPDYFMQRSQLISRKHEVIAQIRRTRRELERETQPQDRSGRRRRQSLEQRLQSLMAEEYRLRLAIDRAKH